MCPVTVTEERHPAGRDKPASPWGAAGPRGEPRTPAAEKPRAPGWVGGLPLGLWDRFCLQPSQGQCCSTRGLAGTAQLPTSPGLPYMVLGPPALQEAGCLPTASLIMDQGLVPSKEPHPRPAFRFLASTTATCVLHSSLRRRCSAQARTTPLGPGLGPQATKWRMQGL